MTKGTRKGLAVTKVILGTVEPNGNRRWGPSIADIVTGETGFSAPDFLNPIRDEPKYSAVAIVVGNSIAAVEANCHGLIHRLTDLTDEELRGVRNHIDQIILERVECLR